MSRVKRARLEETVIRFARARTFMASIELYIYIGTRLFFFSRGWERGRWTRDTTFNLRRSSGDTLLEIGQVEERDRYGSRR